MDPNISIIPKPYRKRRQPSRRKSRKALCRRIQARRKELLAQKQQELLKQEEIDVKEEIYENPTENSKPLDPKNDIENKNMEFEKRLLSLKDAISVDQPLPKKTEMPKIETPKTKLKIAAPPRPPVPPIQRPVRKKLRVLKDLTEFDLGSAISRLNDNEFISDGTFMYTNSAVYIITK